MARISAFDESSHLLESGLGAWLLGSDSAIAALLPWFSPQVRP
jgi:hypothetical protein